MNYSEEEKEAIEQLRNWRDYIIKNKDKVNKANDIEFYLRTVLNLIQKQEHEIGLLKDQKQYVIDEYEETIEKQDKIIDKMAEQLTTPIHSKEWIIEFYKKEVEKDVKD